MRDLVHGFRGYRRGLLLGGMHLLCAGCCSLFLALALRLGAVTLFLLAADLLRELLAHVQARFVDRGAVDQGIRPRQVDVLEHAGVQHGRLGALLRMPEARKAELVQRHRKTLSERIRVVLNSQREKKTINNASLARQLVDIMCDEVFS